MATVQNNFDSYIDLLINNPLFEGATQQSMISLVENCKLKRLIKGTPCIGKDKTHYNFYFITNGKVKVFNLNNSDKQFTLFILSKNDVFDVFTLINNQQHNVCYDVLQDLDVLVISIDALRDWLKKNPLTLNCFFKYTIKKFELLESHILDLGTNNLTARLANLLLQHYNVKNHQIEGINDLTHDELAQLIGTSRAVFNHHIQEFKKAGIIHVSRKHIEILNILLLTELSQTEDPFI